MVYGCAGCMGRVGEYGSMARSLVLAVWPVGPPYLSMDARLCPKPRTYIQLAIMTDGCPRGARASIAARACCAAGPRTVVTATARAAALPARTHGRSAPLTWCSGAREPVALVAMQ